MRLSSLSSSLPEIVERFEIWFREQFFIITKDGIFFFNA